MTRKEIDLLSPHSWRRSPKAAPAQGRAPAWRQCDWTEFVPTSASDFPSQRPRVQSCCTRSRLVQDWESATGLHRPSETQYLAWVLLSCITFTTSYLATVRGAFLP